MKDEAMYYGLLASIPLLAVVMWLTMLYDNRQKVGKRFAKFLVVGALTACINFSGVYILTEWIGFWYMWSMAIVACIALLFNFTGHYLWTFRR